MTEIVTPQYTQRQIELILGKTPPKNNEEWRYAQEHANDVLPVQGGEPKEDQPATQKPIESDFQDRIKQRKERQDDYMRNGS